MRFEAPFRPGWTKGVQGPASVVARITFPVSTSWGGLRTARWHDGPGFDVSWLIPCSIGSVRCGRPLFSQEFPPNV